MEASQENNIERLVQAVLTSVLTVQRFSFCFYEWNAKNIEFPLSEIHYMKKKTSLALLYLIN